MGKYTCANDTRQFCSCSERESVPQHSLTASFFSPYDSTLEHILCFSETLTLSSSFPNMSSNVTKWSPNTSPKDHLKYRVTKWGCRIDIERVSKC